MRIKFIARQKNGKNENPSSHVKSSSARQFVAGSLANLTLINAGLQFAWPAVSLSDLQSDTGELAVTSSEGAWIVCALSMGACLGPIVSALLVNRIGRKWTLLATVVPNISCWTLVYLATKPEMLLAARFIGGIGLGATYSTVPMYIGEIAEKKIRGALGCILCIMVATGNLTTYAIGPLISIRTLALIDMLPSFIFLATFVWMPESPYYYMLKDDQKQAERVLRWLRGRKDVVLELQEICNLTRSEKREKGGIIDILGSSGNRRATLIVCLAIGAQQLSGLLALFAYQGLIFERTAHEIDPHYVILCSGIVILTFNIVAFFIIDKIGRKPLLLVSSMGTTFCLVLIGTYFYTDSRGIDGKDIYWLPMLSVMCFYAFYAIGLGPIPTAILSEVYPLNVKAYATMFVSIYGSILGVGVSKVYQIVADGLGKHVIFYSFATIEFLFGILILCVVFETKGKSFKEIQARLNGRSLWKKSQLSIAPAIIHETIIYQ